MKFFSIIRVSEHLRDEAFPPGMEEAMGKLIEKNVREGVLIDTGGLAPSAQGKRVRLSGGALKVVDGPFTETKELVGGWAIYEARDMAHALELTREFMDLHRKYWPGFEGECEVRPLEFRLLG